MRRFVLASAPLLALACAGAPAPPPPPSDQAPAPHEVAGRDAEGRFDRARAALEAATHETGRIVYLSARAGDRTFAGERYVFSPDDARAVAGVTLVPSGEPAIVVRDLSPERRGAAVRLLARGRATRCLRFVSARGLLVDAGGGSAEIVDVDGGGARALESVGTPAVSADGSLLAAVDKAGSVRLLDTATLAERTRARGVKLVGKLEETTLEFPAPGRLLVTQPDRAILVDAATGAVLHDAAEESGFGWNRPRTSPSGRYFAVSRPSPSKGGFPEIAILDTQRGGRPVARLPVGMSLPAFAFSPDESTLVSSVDPGTVVATDLRTGAKRTIRTGQRVDSEGFGVFTDAVAVGADGHRVCGHVATSIGKYTDCHAAPYADLDTRGPPRADPGDLAFCFVDGDTARFASIPRAILDPTREVLPTATATYTRLCNESLSGDGATLALVDAAAPQKDAQSYEDVEMMLIDVREKKIRHRVPLGSGPTVMGAVLSSEFSSSGHWLAVEYGEASYRLVDVQRGTALSPALPPGRVTQAEHLYIGQDDGVTLLPLPDGAAFTLDPAWSYGKLAEAAGAKEAEEAMKRSPGAWAGPKDEGRVRTYRSTKVPGRVAALVVMDEGASIALLPDGRVELLGPKADVHRAAEGLVCAFGGILAPFEVCAERDRVTGAWESALAGEAGR